MYLVSSFIGINIYRKEDGVLIVHDTISNKILVGSKAYNAVCDFTQHKPEEFGLIKQHGYICPVYRDINTGSMLVQ